MCSHHTITRVRWGGPVLCVGCALSAARARPCTALLRPLLPHAACRSPPPPAEVGISSSALIFMLGLLMSAFTLTGCAARPAPPAAACLFLSLRLPQRPFSQPHIFTPPHPTPPHPRSYDASAHLTEETRDAGRSGPRGIVLTVVVSFVVGWMYLLSLTFSIQVWAARRPLEQGAAPCAAHACRGHAAAPARLPCACLPPQPRPHPRWPSQWHRRTLPTCLIPTRPRAAPMPRLRSSGTRLRCAVRRLRPRDRPLGRQEARPPLRLSPLAHVQRSLPCARMRPDSRR